MGHHIGTLTLGRRGESVFFGQTARTEVYRTYFPTPLTHPIQVFDQCKTLTTDTESKPLIELWTGPLILAMQDQHKPEPIFQAVCRTRPSRTGACD